MKVEDLMVGDIVIVNNFPMQLKYADLCDLLQDKVGKFKIRPFPIMPELLKKNKWFVEQETDDTPEDWVSGSNYILIHGVRNIDKVYRYRQHCKRET